MRKRLSGCAVFCEPATSANLLRNAGYDQVLDIGPARRLRLGEKINDARYD
jgi:hypothetical protein